MKITALLPMKGHSERVPNKNMKSFANKPLYHFVMQTLISSKYIDDIVVNTDSDIIKKDIKENFDSVMIINRPHAIIGDSVSMNKIIAYDLSQLEGKHFLQTHSTNPLLTPNTLDKAVEQYFNKLDTYDSLFSVTKVQTRLYWENGKPINHDPQELQRTQDLPPVFEENSNFYVFSRNSFENAGERRIGTKAQMFEMDKLEAIDIDEPKDFILAELLYKRTRGML